MAISCQWQDLVDAASGYQTLSTTVRRGIRLLLWCKFLNGDSTECDPVALAAESRQLWSCITPDQFDAIETLFVCMFVRQGGGGGGGGQTQYFNGHYGGEEPPFSPEASAATADDLDAPFSHWIWADGAWQS